MAAAEKIKRVLEDYCVCGLRAIIVKDGRGYCNNHAWIIDDSKELIQKMGQER